MTWLQNFIRDWWRGYSNEDIASAIRKMEGPHEPGSIVPVSNRELRAYVAFSRKSICT